MKLGMDKRYRVGKKASMMRYFKPENEKYVIVDTKEKKIVYETNTREEAWPVWQEKALKEKDGLHRYKMGKLVNMKKYLK
jgi:hypothetical protein